MTLIDTRNTVPEGVETHPQQTPRSANSQQVVSDVSEILNFFCLAGSMMFHATLTGFGIPSKDPPRVVKRPCWLHCLCGDARRCPKHFRRILGFQELRSDWGIWGWYESHVCHVSWQNLANMCQHLWEKSRSTQDRTGRFVKSMAPVVVVVVVTALLGVVTTHLLVARSVLLEVNPQQISYDLHRSGACLRMCLYRAWQLCHARKTSCTSFQVQIVGGQWSHPYHNVPQLCAKFCQKQYDITLIEMQDLSFRSGAPIFGPDISDRSNRSKRNGPRSIKALIKKDVTWHAMTRYKWSPSLRGPLVMLRRYFDGRTPGDISSWTLENLQGNWASDSHTPSDPNVKNTKCRGMTKWKLAED